MFEQILRNTRKITPIVHAITNYVTVNDCANMILAAGGSPIMMERAAIEIAKGYKGNILIKGGHLEQSSDDLLYHEEEFHWFVQQNIENHNTHGTGCTLSSAIACHLAEGLDLKSSVEKAKAYITGALKDQLNLGKGNGPLNHLWG